MRTIWKYEVPVAGEVTLDMPRDAKILDVRHVPGTHQDIVTFWAEVDTNRHTETRRFEVFGTGHEIPATGKPLGHIGTAHTALFVWHLYERMR